MTAAKYDRAKLRIEPINSNDLPTIKAASKLILRVFNEFERPNSEKKGVKLFRKFVSPSEIHKHISEGIFLARCAFCGDKLAGIICMRDNHISLLFVDKSMQRLGIGRRLVLSFLSDFDFPFITVNASSYAVPFYASLGFLPTAPPTCADGITVTPMLLNQNES